jgi:CubicO group peptidase (beta-lactamase class C family)
MGNHCIGCNFKKEMKGMKRGLLFFIALVVFAHAIAQDHLAADSISVFISRKTDSAFDKNKVNCIFVGVISNGKHTYYSKGFANPDLQLQFDSATLFEIGSITKTFTAYVLQKILIEKKIPDRASILPYLPDSVQSNKALEKITFLSLMNHTSGLPRLPGNLKLSMENKIPYDQYTSANLFEFLTTCKPAPDGKSNYSNLGMGLAGVLAERIAKKNYAVLLQQNIFKPFKMMGAMEVFSTETNKSQGYFDKEKVPYWNMNVLAPAGGLKCTGKEMLAYLEYMANPKDRVAEKVIASLLQPTVSINALVKVCKAWHTLEEKDKPVIYWHNGGTYGFSTFAAFIKGQQKAVIVAVNKFNQNNISDGLGMAIMKELIK